MLSFLNYEMHKEKRLYFFLNYGTKEENLIYLFFTYGTNEKIIYKRSWTMERMNKNECIRSPTIDDLTSLISVSKNCSSHANTDP